jgi:diguanylate cyclase (GGDEF)-like protein
MNHRKNSAGKRKILSLFIIGLLSVVLVINAILHFNSANYFISMLNLISLICIFSFIVLFYLHLMHTSAAEHKRKMLDTQLKSILEDASEAIAAVDTNFKYITFNHSYQTEFRKVFGKNIYIGMTLADAFANTPAYHSKLLNSWNRALAGEKTTEVLELGENFYEITSSPMDDENHHIIGALHISRDITRRVQQDKATRELNERLTYEMQELGIHNEKMLLLIELSDVVQACVSIQEATKAIAVKCRRILHFAEGSLFIKNASNVLEQATTWGEPAEQEKIISPMQCWALRKGGMYQVKNPQTDLICEHIAEKTAVPYMCIPLMAQNSIFGLLHLDFFSGDSTLSDENRILVSAISETLSLALANIKLREILRNQSLHDSLTGLYNRRYLEEFLTKEIHLTQRNNTHLAVVMIDIDHFKLFNDKYGHEAGDLVLQEFAKFLQNEIRVSDFACRYGGEEFLCVLHDCNLESAKLKAEEFRNKVSTIALIHDYRPLERITISLGISICPENGSNVNELIEAADKALYLAKVTRNRTIAYSEMTLTDASNKA